MFLKLTGATGKRRSSVQPSSSTLAAMAHSTKRFRALPNSTLFPSAGNNRVF